jgi:hypothetical protein
MVAQRAQKMSVEEYLAFDRASAERHMFANGQIYLQAGFYEKVEFWPGDDVSLGT